MLLLAHCLHYKHSLHWRRCTKCFIFAMASIVIYASYPYKILRLYKVATTLLDCYNLVYKVVHSLVTLSPHCDKLVFETCNSLVTTL